MAEQATNKQIQKIGNAAILTVTTLKEGRKISFTFDEVRQPLQISGGEGPKKGGKFGRQKKFDFRRD